MKRRRHISERDANIAMFILLLLACVGIFTLAKWVVSFWMMLLMGLLA